MLEVSRQAYAPIRFATSWPMLLVCLALLVPVVQLVMGVRMIGYHRAHDGAFALSGLVQFRSELLAGDFFPRWSVAGNSGLGSPTFFYYPPLAYYIASLLNVALPAFPAATIIGLTQILFRAGAMLACFVWLRRRTTADAAMIASALYGLMPYVAIVNPQMRLAFSECAASMLVPLAFLAVDVGRGDFLRTVGWVAVTICGLAFVNLPTTVHTGGLIVVYAAFSSTAWRDGLRFAVTAGLGVGLGLGLAACNLFPALGLLDAIPGSTSFWGPNFQPDFGSNFDPENNFLMTSNAIRQLHGRSAGLLLDLGLLVPTVLVLVFGRYIVRARSSWALVATFVVSVFLTTSPSEPVWAVLTPLRTVEFPWRFLLPISLLSAASVAIALPASPTLLYRLAIAAGLSLATAALAYGILLGDHMSPGSARTQQALSSPAANAVFYIPIEAAAHGWLDFAEQSDDFRTRSDSLVPACVKRSADGDRLTFSIDGCSGPTVVPQFYFPGWAAQANESSLSVAPDPASGLVSVDIPPGTRRVVLRRQTLGIERAGLAVSVLFLCGWAAIMLVATRFRRPPRSAAE
jgi:hypothetical protein